MAVSDFMKPGFSDKRPARIITVDIGRRRVEAALKDGGMVYAAIWDIPMLFRWPKTEEVWMLRKDQGIWRLDSLIETIQTNEENKPIAEMVEGEARIVAEPSLRGSGLFVGKHHAARMYQEDIGDDFSTAFTITHGLGLHAVTVTVREQPRITTLTTIVDAASETFVVEGTALFSGSGTAYIEDEIFTYSGVTSTTLTGVVRGQEGTEAVIHQPGVVVAQGSPLAAPTILPVDENRLRVVFGGPPTLDQYKVVVTG